MCGICGIAGPSPGQDAAGLVRRMCGALAHRGPDDEEVVSLAGAVLGHRRLSVLDTSPAGHQPMANATGTLWITYNGEVYNFRALAANMPGRPLRSGTDTEVLLHLYEEHGPDMVHGLEGMFAFAIWDEQRQRLFAARDRCGIKPLLYARQGPRLVFASEMKALLEDRDMPREIDPVPLSLYLAFGYVPAPRTIFKGVYKLPPGHRLFFENGEVQVERYWKAPGYRGAPPVRRFRSGAEAQEALFSAVDRAVAQNLVSDVPLGAFLSGGLDSSVVVALMARHSHAPVKTFSIGYAEGGMYDETRYARDVASMYGTDHHEFRLAPADLLGSLDTVLDALDEPFSDSSALPTYAVAKAAREHVTVALSGDGGDELFAGYRAYLSEPLGALYGRIPSLLRRGVAEPLLDMLPESRESLALDMVRRARKFVASTRGTPDERLLRLKEIFPAEVRRRVLAGGEPGPGPALAHLSGVMEGYAGDPVNRALYSDFADSLPGDMLCKVDLMSMRNSLEVRVPLLDHPVAELAFSMPGDWKLKRLRTKYLFRKTFLPLLPKSLHNRPKQGFEVPLSRWLRTDLRFLVEDYLNRDRLGRQGLFSPDAVEELVRQHLSRRRDTSWMLWNLIAFQAWHERTYA